MWLVKFLCIYDSLSNQQHSFVVERSMCLRVVLEMNLVNYDRDVNA